LTKVASSLQADAEHASDGCGAGQLTMTAWYGILGFNVPLDTV